LDNQLALQSNKQSNLKVDNMTLESMMLEYQKKIDIDKTVSEEKKKEGLK
jgi:hypothetical protein